MVKLFISYSHKDEALRDTLDTHLSLLKNQGIIQVWYDRRIGAGEEVALSIDDNLNDANIILLLISPDFLASPYCWGIEVKQAMERHEARAARVIPVILRACDWQSAPFGKLLAAPKDGKPIKSWSDTDEAFYDVARQIRAAAESPATKPGIKAPVPPAKLRTGTDYSDTPEILPGSLKGVGLVYCSRCGMAAGKQTRCLSPYTPHEFTKSGKFGAYCSRCGVAAGVQTKCMSPYTTHEFVNAIQRGAYCSRCGALAGAKSKCTSPYTTHEFVLVPESGAYCSRCGVVIGTQSKCMSPYTVHDFVSG